jgi:hypothetical protein
LEVAARQTKSAVRTDEKLGFLKPAYAGFICLVAVETAKALLKGNNLYALQSQHYYRKR